MLADGDASGELFLARRRHRRVAIAASSQSQDARVQRQPISDAPAPRRTSEGIKARSHSWSLFISGGWPWRTDERKMRYSELTALLQTGAEVLRYVVFSVYRKLY